MSGGVIDAGGADGNARTKPGFEQRCAQSSEPRHKTNPAGLLIDSQFVVPGTRRIAYTSAFAQGSKRRTACGARADHVPSTQGERVNKRNFGGWGADNG